MPNKRANRRRKKNKKVKSNDKKIDSAFIDNFIKNYNVKSNGGHEFKKFLVYGLERQLYGPDLTKDFFIFCLSSYFILKHNYENLEFMLVYDLFPIDLIREEALKGLNFHAGVNDQILQLIKLKTENFNVQNKIVVLVMDETTIQPNLHYDEKCDYIVGFTDNGKVRSSKIAKYVTNIWINCVGGKWALPFAYIFTENSASIKDIKNLLFESIRKLKRIGLDIVGVVTKMRTNFYALSEELNISPTNQTFEVDGQKLLFLYDVAQLMNITRNNLMKYKLKFEDMQTSWKYIKQFFLLEKENKIDKKTKLTINHLKPNNKMKTIPHFAIELLSNSVAIEMKECIASEKLPNVASGTAEFIDMLDRLFDMLNSQHETSINEYNSSFKGTKHQHKFMEKMITFFENLKVFDNEGHDCTDKVKFIKGWLISVKSILQLWDLVKAKGHLYLLTRNINCELLDKFILGVTLFHTILPTAEVFVHMYSELFRSAYFDEDNCPVEEQDCSNFNMESYIKKIYKRIPATKHDLRDTTVQVNETIQDECTNTLNIFDKFIEEYSDFLY